MSEALIILVALGYAAMGAGALVRPADVLAQFGVELETANGRNEVRAVYGGFGLATAAVLAFAALGEPSTADGIVVAVACGLAGMATGRLLSAMRERPTGFHPIWTYFAIEVAAAAMLLLAI